MKSRFYIHLLITLFFAVVIALAYRDLPRTFFEQDEWHSFGYYNYLVSFGTADFLVNSLRSGPLNHFTPLSLFSKLTMFKIFGLNATYYLFVSIILHTLVSVSVYVLIINLVKRIIPAFLGGLFFAINSSHHQAVTWIGTFEGAELSVLLGVLSLISFLYYKQGYRQIFIYSSLFLIFMALLFKETAISFFLVIAILLLADKNIRTKKNILSIGGVFITYFVFRLNYIFFNQNPTAAAINQSDTNIISALIYNFLTIPVKVFSILSIPNDFFINFTNRERFKFDLGIGPWSIDYAIFYDLFTIGLGIFIAIFIYKITRKIENKFPLYLGLLIIVFSIAPLLILKKYLTYIDSRYLYQVTVGFSIVLGVLIMPFFSYTRRTVTAALLFGLLIYTSHIYYLQILVQKDIKIGETRRGILSQIKRDYPQLPQNAIFYTESNISYYGVLGEEKILPFQSGFGQTLLIWYSQEERFPKEFFTDDFLWEISSQGFKEVDGKGFGYFRDFELLKKVVKENNISVNSVIAYSWEDEGRLLNITDRVKKKLSTQL